MVGNIYLLTICSLAIGIEAKTISIASSFPYIFNLELKFNEEKLNDFIIDSFFATNGDENNKLLHCDITLSDILKAIPYKKLAVSDFATAVNQLNLTLTDDDVGNFISNLDYNELSAMGFSMEKFQKNFVKTYFKGRPAALLECLNILGITEDFSVAHSFGTDGDVFKAFQNANFSKDNLEKIRNIINTPTTLKDILNILGVKKFNEIYLADFVNHRVAPLLFEKGLTEENFKQFLISLNISLSNYKNSKTFKKCYNTITSGNSLAVAISDNEIITNDDSVILKYLNLEQYTTLIAKNVQSEAVRYTILADNIDGNRTDNIIRITIDAILPSYIEETNTYSDISEKYCHYVSLVDDELEAQGIAANVVNDQLVISKPYNTLFKKGSPLICGQKLYGLASVDKTSAIVFDTVEESFAEEVSSLPEHYKPEIINIIKEFFEDLKSNFDPCKYNLCNNEEQKEETGNESEAGANNAENSENVEENSSENTNNEENNEDNNDATATGDENNVNENTDENNNLEQNEQESDIAQSEDRDAESENSVGEEQNDQNNQQADSDQSEQNAENQSNSQDETNSSQEVSESSDNIGDSNQTSQESDNQSNINDSNQELEEGDANQTNGENSNQIPQEEDDTQTNIDNSNQLPQEEDDSQTNVSETNQEPQEADVNQENVNDLNQEPLEGNGEVGNDEDIQNANEQETNNDEANEDTNTAQSNQGILEGRSA